MRVAETFIGYVDPVPPSERPQIAGSRDCYEILMNNCYQADTIQHREKFVVLYLNIANRVLSWQTIGLGGIDSTVADVRMILQKALMWNATRIILSHNHPSGNLTPSQSDIRLTEKVKSAAALMDIKVHDHIIVSAWDYYSFADAGQI